MFVIDKAVCTQCDECKDACPCDAIVTDADGKYTVDPEACAECGACLDVCEFAAVSEQEIPSRQI